MLTNIRKNILALLAVTLLLPSEILAQQLDIVSRESWRAEPPIDQREPQIKTVKTGKHRVVAENQIPKRGEIKYLTIHHTARKASKLNLEKNLKAFQQQMFSYIIDYGNGVSKRIYLGDIPYHYFIDSEGKIGEGRELKYAAYSNTNYSTPIENHVTIVLDGNFEKDNPTDAQIFALTNLLKKLMQEHSVSLSNIKVHSDVADTKCPGKNLKTKLSEIKIELTKRGVEQ